MIKDIVEAAFKKEMKKLVGEKSDVFQFLLTHPRRQKCMDNITSEVFKLELSSKVILTSAKIESITNDVVRIFVNAATLEAIQKKESKAEQRRQRLEADRESELMGQKDEWIKDGLIKEEEREETFIAPKIPKPKKPKKKKIMIAT